MLETAWESRWMPDSLWGCSSVGRAPALQAGGQEFESLHLHSPKGDITYVPWKLHIENLIQSSNREVWNKYQDIRGVTRKCNQTNQKQAIINCKHHKPKMQRYASEKWKAPVQAVISKSFQLSSITFASQMPENFETSPYGSKLPTDLFQNLQPLSFLFG